MEIQCSDGRRLTGTLFAPAAAHGPARYVIINSATGVRRRFYLPFAQHLCDAGFHVLTWDARGMGDSALGHPRHDRARMRNWGALDLEAVLQHTLAQVGGDGSRIAIVGHSSGGHLCGLAPSLSRIGQLALVASSTCDWRLYPRHEWPRLLGAWYVLAPLVLRTLGYMPGQLGIGHDLPPGVAGDWRNWSVRPGYLFTDASLDLSGYAAFRGDLLALHFTDDTGFAPPEAVSDLLRHFVNARHTREAFDPRRQGHRPVGHFGFFQPKNADLWPRVTAWLGRPA